MKIVLGLGNPGARYRQTRHNMGFRVVECLAECRGGSFKRRRDLGGVAWTASIHVGESVVLLAKPTTYMNRSGRAARALREHLAVEPGDMLVVHDDADLELGRVRLRPGGGAGGHNGIRSLVGVLGTDAFPRLRLGVRGDGRDSRDLADYVLDDFEPSERPVAEALVRLGAEAAETAIVSGLEAAMNEFNARVAAEAQRETTP